MAVDPYGFVVNGHGIVPKSPWACDQDNDTLIEMMIQHECLVSVLKATGTPTVIGHCIVIPKQVGPSPHPIRFALKNVCE